MPNYLLVMLKVPLLPMDGLCVKMHLVKINPRKTPKHRQKFHQEVMLQEKKLRKRKRHQRKQNRRKNLRGQSRKELTQGMLLMILEALLSGLSQLKTVKLSTTQSGVQLQLSRSGLLKHLATIAIKVSTIFARKSLTRDIRAPNWLVGLANSHLFAWSFQLGNTTLTRNTKSGGTTNMTSTASMCAYS